ncbi:hypothetical protein [Lactobacillus sp. CBA3605]|uniref:hypothetical protein n=1 Tax=Lactobacillus sp. CBA3605 TaxID=2099788 RepID=UPI00131A25C6|nr:hypothetical protein [Lactobacillus sp. CBA3605]
MTELTNEQIEAIAILGAKAGVKAYRDSHKRTVKSEYQKNLRNTKPVLTNYYYLEDT